MQESYLSIIIPAYNADQTLPQLLLSLQQSKRAPGFEVIVVDDASDERIKNQELRIKNTKIYLRIVHHRRNRGPAAARNTGAKNARGVVLVFLDSDVEVFPDTLYRLGRVFQNDPDLFALTGVWDKRQKSRAFFPRFKALRDWSYWINERHQRGYYYLFSTRIAAIRRDLFLRLGGFDERYKTASVEDIEFTYRVARRYAVVFDHRVKVKHEFEDFWPVAKKYFRRSKAWSELYSTRGKFDPVAATRSEAVTAISAVGLVGGGILLVFFYSLPSTVYGLQLKLLQLFLFAVVCSLFALHLYGVRKFLRFVYREEGLLFAIQSFFMGIILYIIIVAGSAAFTWERIRKRLDTSV